MSKQKACGQNKPFTSKKACSCFNIWQFHDRARDFAVLFVRPCWGRLPVFVRRGRIGLLQFRSLHGWSRGTNLQVRQMRKNTPNIPRNSQKCALHHSLTKFCASFITYHFRQWPLSFASNNGHDTGFRRSPLMYPPSANPHSRRKESNSSNLWLGTIFYSSF